MFTKYPLVALIPFYIAAVNAANDWSVPCTSGICEWDTKDGDTSGNIIVTAATSALSDITPAAGWHILDCDPTSLDSQTIRLVCESADGDEAGCNAIDEGGAENTVVRLPNSCGGGPFARLVRIWDSTDQSIPDAARQKFRKRAPTPPGTVKNAIVDFDFGAVPPENDVDILATGSNSPLAPVSEQAVRLRRAFSSQKMRRAVLKKPRPSKAASDAPKPSQSGSETADSDLVKGFLDKLGALNKQGVRKNGGFEASVHKKDFAIAQGSVTCEATEKTPIFNGKLDVKVDLDIEGTVSYGFAVEGKLVPPKLEDVGYYAAYSGNASALWHIAAGAEAEFSIGRIEAINIPMSPLSVPGIVNIGPKFSVGVSSAAKIGLTGNMDIGTTLIIPKVEMRFPPKQAGPSSGVATASKAPLKVEVSPQATIGGSFEGHITPRIALGVDMLNGLAKAEIFMETDVKGSIDLGVTLAKSAGANSTASVTGCVGLNSAITARVGAEGGVFPFFDRTTAFDIFTKEFALFKKCFAAASPSKAPALLARVSPSNPSNPSNPSKTVVTPRKTAASAPNAAAPTPNAPASAPETPPRVVLTCPPLVSGLLNLINNQ